MLVILEGVDGTGKTTLAEAIKRYFYGPVYVVKFSNPKTAEMFQDAAYARGEYMAAIRVFKAIMEKQPNAIIICDRFHLGEFAYGPVKRNYPEWLAERSLEIEDEMIKELGWDNIKMVLLTVSVGHIESVVERSNRPGEYLVKADEYSRVDHRYIMAYEKTKLQCEMFFVDRYGQDTIADHVIRFLVG